MVIGRGLVTAGTLLAAAFTVHTVRNLRVVPVPRAATEPITETVSVLIPARDEATTVAAAVRSAVGQRQVGALEVIVLDDGSVDGTAAIVDALADDDPRVQARHAATDPPPGWLGKPWACARLAQDAGGSVLVFVDADVRLAPDAVAAAVGVLRSADVAMVSPYPRQIAGTWLEHLTQPLVTWAWLALLPLAWQQRSTRPSLSAATGQFVVVDAAAYRAVGGHAAVRDRVVEDVALMAALRRAGFGAWTVDGSHLARCRMYDGARSVVDGYGKSLWSAFGGPAGSTAVAAVLALAYLGPVAGAVLGRDRRTRAVGLAGYVAAVGSRALVARRTGEPVAAALTHPASIAAFLTLTAVSWARHRRGTLRWKGRPVTVAGPVAT